MMNLNGEDKKMFEEYKLSRHEIQMVDAKVIDCTARLFEKSDTEEKYGLSFNIYKKMGEHKGNKIIGYLKAKAYIENANSKKKIAEFVVECEGVFVAGKILDDDEFKTNVNLQIVPQLLPYARSAITSLSSLLRVPIVIPTMDIIKSIKINR